MTKAWPIIYMPWCLLRSSLSRIPAGHLRLVLLLASAGAVWGSIRLIAFMLQEWRLQRSIRRRRALASAEKTRLRQRLAEREDGVLSRRDNIIDLPFSSLLSALQDGRMKPSEVLAAFQASALLADDACNCLTSVLKSAESAARRLDSKTTAERRALPLFGVPISVKEHLAISGEDCTFGNASYVGRSASGEAAVIRVLKGAGAVPFVRSNMSQMGFAIDCANPLFGETLNPHDPSRSPGGSSGGEAALVALGGSPLGIGSDVGGSIRIPAALCGCCGFKPTAERVSSLDCPPVEHAQSYVVSLSIGPLARDVAGLEVASRALFSSDMMDRDPCCPPLPFRDPQPGAPLTIGYYVSLKGEEVIRAVPAAQRAVMEAKEALERRGHRLIPWSPPHTDWMQVCLAPYFTDSGHGLSVACESEKVTRDLALCAVLFSLPSLVRAAHLLLIRPFSLLLSRQMNAMRGCGSVYRLWRFMETLGAYNARFVAQWKKQGLDALICPPLPFAAPPLGHSGLLSSAVIYCSLYNVLNLPAGVLPVTEVSSRDIARLEKEYPSDDLLLKLLKRGQQGTQGLPVGVQCVTMRWQDELCLYVMKEVEGGLQISEEE